MCFRDAATRAGQTHSFFSHLRRRLSMKKALLHYVIAVMFVAVCIAAIGAACGCQVDVSAGLGYKAFYPNKGGSKDKDIGDPRKGMYDGSGFGESHTSGSSNGNSEHFHGLKEGR